MEWESGAREGGGIFAKYVMGCKVQSREEGVRMRATQIAGSGKVLQREEKLI